MVELRDNPERDLTTIDVDLKFSTLKPMHGKLMGSMYKQFQLTKGCEINMNGWKAAGIFKAVEDARNNIASSLNPFTVFLLI